MVLEFSSVDISRKVQCRIQNIKCCGGGQVL